MTSTPDPSSASAIVDDKSPLCIPFILERLAIYRKAQEAADPPRRRPFVVGINGVQGIGKTTLVTTLYETLQQQHGLETLVVSIDDFYLPHAAQRALAAAHPDNALVQVRGQPGTHDTALLAAFMDALLTGTVAHVPAYDKAAFGGQGDRTAPTPADPGRVVNGPGQRPVEVVVVEGWCVGFRALPPAAIEAKRADAKKTPAFFMERYHASMSGTPLESNALAAHPLEHLLFVNEQLPAYDAALTRHLDAFIHLDAEDIRDVYVWRREQEAALRRARGPDAGMTDDQVTRFVDAYYPAYQLYSDGVRNGVFLGLRQDGKDDGTADVHGRQLRLVVDRHRKVIQSQII